ncbi:MAG TPA: hypothetical protein VGS80_10070, partial [Ktedonobacterales bacterium]|nr:hypothetical protein [Ktedonobacterales bacterium]
ESEAKLLRAGANRVLSPYRLGGHRMAALALQPEMEPVPEVGAHAADRGAADGEAVVGKGEGQRAEAGE